MIDYIARMLGYVSKSENDWANYSRRHYLDRYLTARHALHEIKAMETPNAAWAARRMAHIARKALEQ